MDSPHNATASIVLGTILGLLGIFFDSNIVAYVMLVFLGVGGLVLQAALIATNNYLEFMKSSRDEWRDKAVKRAGCEDQSST